jgi:hypothetical protein
MTIKNKLLEEIGNKAKKIRQKRVEAANNKTIEAAVFEFFRNAEEARALHENKFYDMAVLKSARISLIERLKIFDSKVKISIEWNHQYDTATELPNADLIRGVTIWWSQEYIKRNNCHPSLYVDVSNMLFI